MSRAVAKRSTDTKIGRPLKILIPLIQEDVEHGDRAGMQYYADAGDKLLEAKPQVAHGAWGRWLSKNFGCSHRVANRYMRLAALRAEQQNGRQSSNLPSSLNELDGGKARRQERKKKRDRPFRTVLEELETDFYTQEELTREKEIDLHRELALELIDVGYKALATRLHPDRGGSTEAMTRLNRIREELQGFAKKRRFV